MSACCCIPYGMPDRQSGTCAKCGKAVSSDPAQAERDRLKAALAMQQRRLLARVGVGREWED